MQLGASGSGWSQEMATGVALWNREWTAMHANGVSADLISKEASEGNSGPAQGGLGLPSGTWGTLDFNWFLGFNLICMRRRIRLWVVKLF